MVVELYAIVSAAVSFWLAEAKFNGACNGSVGFRNFNVFKPHVGSDLTTPVLVAPPSTDIR
jgi:hypothetical protein